MGSESLLLGRFAFKAASLAGYLLTGCEIDPHGGEKWLKRSDQSPNPVIGPAEISDLRMTRRTFEARFSDGLKKLTIRATDINFVQMLLIIDHTFF